MQVTIDGTSREVDGRVREIIRWLMLNAEVVNKEIQGEIAFSFSGSIVRPIKRFFEEPIKIKDRA